VGKGGGCMNAYKCAEKGFTKKESCLLIVLISLFVGYYALWLAYRNVHYESVKYAKEYIVNSVIIGSHIGPVEEVVPSMFASMGYSSTKSQTPWTSEISSVWQKFYVTGKTKGVVYLRQVYKDNIGWHVEWAVLEEDNGQPITISEDQKETGIYDGKGTKRMMPMEYKGEIKYPLNKESDGPGY
jgi:hypothetical protein